MTRAEVAKRIGRSIATVRRMEGKELHPSVDWNGVHLFDPDEVEAVAQELKENGRRSLEYTNDLPPFLLASRIKTVEYEKENLTGELEDLQKKLDRMSGIEEVAAKLLTMTDEALRLAEGAGSRQARWLRMDFDRLVRSISD